MVLKHVLKHTFAAMHEEKPACMGNRWDLLVNGEGNPGPGQKNQAQWKATDNAHLHFEKG